MKKNKTSKAITAFNMLKDGRPSEEILEICSRSTLKKVRAEYNRKKKLGEELILDKYPKWKRKDEEKASEEKLFVNETLKSKTAGIKSNSLKTLNELMSDCQIDPEKFECTEFTSNIYGKPDSPSIQCKGVFRSKTMDVISPKEHAVIFKEIVKDYRPNHIKKRYFHGESEKYAAVLPIADLHLGSVSVKEETGEENNLKIAEKILTDSMLFHRNHVFKYDIEKIIIPVLGDFFNSDTVFSTTTKGTYQENVASWKKSFRFGCELIVKIIDSFSNIVPVEVFVCRGNHDEMSSYYLQCFLEAFYKNSDVVIDNSNTLRKYTNYGNTSFGFSHGDEKSNADYLSIMLSELNVESKFREFLIAHTHHTKQEEKPGINIRRIGSLCPDNTWHKKMGYVSKKSSEGYIVSKENGVICNTTFYAN